MSLKSSTVGFRSGSLGSGSVEGQSDGRLGLEDTRRSSGQVVDKKQLHSSLPQQLWMVMEYCAKGSLKVCLVSS